MGDLRRDLNEQRCFVRFGKAPPDGISRDHRTGKKEPGLSVFPAFEAEEGYYVDSGEHGLARATLRIHLALRFPAYLATGRVSGMGTCGEPTLSDFDLTPIPARFVHDIRTLSTEANAKAKPS